MTPTIHSFRVERVGEKWQARGSCSLGPINRTGDTEQEAIQLAKMQIREYVRKYSARAYAECIQRKQDYFSRKMA